MASGSIDGAAVPTTPRTPTGRVAAESSVQRSRDYFDWVRQQPPPARDDEERDEGWRAGAAAAAARAAAARAAA